MHKKDWVLVVVVMCMMLLVVVFPGDKPVTVVDTSRIDEFLVIVKTHDGEKWVRTRYKNLRTGDKVYIGQGSDTLWQVEGVEEP